MASNRDLNLPRHYTRISELGSYTIEKGDPDPRGWSVVSTDGTRIGTVDDLVVDTSAMKVRQLIVELDDDYGRMAASDGGAVLLDVNEVDLRNERREVVAPGTWSGQSTGTGQERYTARDTTAGTQDRTRLTRTEEELHIGKREVQAGEAVVTKHVETERVSEPVTRRREEVVIERRPVEAGMRGDATIGEDEIRVPLMEEEIVVEKRPVVKEELVIGKRTVEERDTVETELRREEFDLDGRAADVNTRTPRRDREH